MCALHGNGSHKIKKKMHRNLKIAYPALCMAAKLPHTTNRKSLQNIWVRYKEKVQVSGGFDASTPFLPLPSKPHEGDKCGPLSAVGAPRAVGLGHPLRLLGGGPPTEGEGAPGGPAEEGQVAAAGAGGAGEQTLGCPGRLGGLGKRVGAPQGGWALFLAAWIGSSSCKKKQQQPDQPLCTGRVPLSKVSQSPPGEVPHSDDLLLPTRHRNIIPFSCLSHV